MFHQYHQQSGGRVEKRKEPGSPERQPDSLCGWVGFKAFLTPSAYMGYTLLLRRCVAECFL